MKTKITVLIVSLAAVAAFGQSTNAPSAHIAWDAVTNNMTGIVYQVFQSTDATNYTQLGTTTNTDYYIPYAPLTVGVKNYFAVSYTAIEGGTNAVVSELSAPVTITKAAAPSQPRLTLTVNVNLTVTTLTTK